MATHEQLTTRHSAALATIAAHFDAASVEATGGGCYAIAAQARYPMLFSDSLDGLSRDDDDAMNNTTWLAGIYHEDGHTMAQIECSDLATLCAYIAALSDADCAALEANTEAQAFDILTLEVGH
jgi:hypothetical protein